MVEKYVKALTDGYIIAVNWSSIEEMLGEQADRLHECSICPIEDGFPPKPQSTDQLTEDQIAEVLRRSNVKFMADTFKDGLPFLPIEIRYFSCATPKTGPWNKNPNYN